MFCNRNESRYVIRLCYNDEKYKEVAMRKKLIIIGGVPGVGKTTVAELLKNALQNAVWLDGDWCWMMHPWRFQMKIK